MHSSLSPGAGASDVADGVPSSKSTLQNYRIPYPSAPENDTPRKKFICARAFLVLMNLSFFLVGFSATVTSIDAASKPAKCELCHSVLNILLAFGLVTCLIAALGIFGALTNSYKVLLVYVTLAAFLFMVQLVMFFWTLLGRANFKRRMHEMYRNKMRNNPHQVAELLDLVQKKMPCCGVDGPMDYHSAGLQLPPSCCVRAGLCGAQTGSSTPPPLFSTTLNTNTTANTNTTTNTNTTESTTKSNITERRAFLAFIEPEEKPPEVREKPPSQGVTTGPENTTITTLTESKVDNASMIVLNSTGVLTGNFSLNDTDGISLADIFGNRTSQSGDPDLRNMKRLGCYNLLWLTVDHMRSVVVGLTLGIAVILTIQLVVLCCAYRVTRGDYIQYA